MTESHDISALGPGELALLFAEIRLYLEAVDLFRREGCEPRWRRENRETEVLP